MQMRILNFSPNRELAVLRACLLRLRGCDVETCFALEDALSRLGTEDYAAIILCHETGDRSFEKLRSELRRHSSLGVIIYISGPEKLYVPEADFIIDPHDPQALVEVAEHVCSEVKSA